jgi:NitT/TauT family transport system substrate-binding protein
MAAASHGGDVKIVGCHWLAAPHGVYVRPRIASIADLKGKAVAVSSPGSFPEIFARAAFEKAGIPAGQVRFASMGSDTDRYKALMAGVVDGAIISNEYVPIAGQDGDHAAIRDLMPAREAMPDFIRVCIEMTGKTLRDRRPSAVRFLAAEIDGLRFAMSHREETIRVAGEITGQKPGDPRPGFVFDAAVRAGSRNPGTPPRLILRRWRNPGLRAAGGPPSGLRAREILPWVRSASSTSPSASRCAPATRCRASRRCPGSASPCGTARSPP